MAIELNVCRAGAAVVVNARVALKFRLRRGGRAYADEFAEVGTSAAPL
jgi:hypothetical protein